MLVTEPGLRCAIRLSARQAVVVHEVAHAAVLSQRRHGRSRGQCLDTGGVHCGACRGPDRLQRQRQLRLLAFGRLGFPADVHGSLVVARLHRSPRGPRARGPRRRATAGCDLEEWERAWRGDEVAHSGMFRPELLGDPHPIVMAGTDASGAIKAGGVACEAAKALGITNTLRDIKGFLGALLPHASTKQVVCYERGEALRSARQRGFKTLGPLNAWTGTV